MPQSSYFSILPGHCACRKSALSMAALCRAGRVRRLCVQPDPHPAFDARCHIHSPCRKPQQRPCNAAPVAETAPRAGTSQGLVLLHVASEEGMPQGSPLSCFSAALGGAHTVYGAFMPNLVRQGCLYTGAHDAAHATKWCQNEPQINRLVSLWVASQPTRVGSWKVTRRRRGPQILQCRRRWRLSPSVESG